MARRPITRELYDALLRGFRESPGNASHAARIAGVERRMAMRGWDSGWVPRLQWAIPIKDVIQLEKEQARALRSKLQEEESARIAAEMKAASEDAVKTRTQEAQGVSATRGNALALAAVCAQLLQATVPLAKRIAEAMKTITLGDEASVRRALAVVVAVSSVTRQGADAIRAALEMERLRLGQPTAIVRVEDVSLADALEELEAVTRTKERAQLYALEGGKSA